MLTLQTQVSSEGDLSAPVNVRASNPTAVAGSLTISTCTGVNVGLLPAAGWTDILHPKATWSFGR